jgi:hypothetical protein
MEEIQPHKESTGLLCWRMDWRVISAVFVLLMVLSVFILVVSDAATISDIIVTVYAMCLLFVFSIPGLIACILIVGRHLRLLAGYFALLLVFSITFPVFQELLIIAVSGVISGFVLRCCGVSTKSMKSI